MVINLIKGGYSRHFIKLSDQGFCTLKKHKPCFEYVCKKKKAEHFVFTAKKDNSKHISREAFAREINCILKKACDKYGKHLRSHSFRVSYITDLLKKTSIDNVKDLIGHCDIKSTLTYKRSKLTAKKLKIVLQALDETTSKKTMVQ